MDTNTHATANPSPIITTSRPWVNEHTGALYCSASCAAKSEPKAFKQEWPELHETSPWSESACCDRCGTELRNA